MAQRATNVCRNQPRVRDRSARLTAGFTLIEVVVALAVLAVAMSAVMRVISQSIDIAAEMRSRTVALWVAQDRLTNHRLTRNWPALETKDDKATMLGLEWRVREQVSTTQVPEMRRIDIEVRAAGGDHVLARVSGFLRQP